MDDLEKLLKRLKDRESNVRESAAGALVEIGEALKVEPLVQGLKDKDPDIRESAAKALCEIGEPAVEPLLRLLGDQDPDIRESAAKALCEIGEPAVEPLILSLWDDEEDVLKTVSEILDKIDINWVSRKDTSKRYLRYFSEALKQGNTPVKIYIIGVLEKIGDFGVPELLARALEDRDRDVRLRAAKALKRIKV